MLPFEGPDIVLQQLLRLMRLPEESATKKNSRRSYSLPGKYLLHVSIIVTTAALLQYVVSSGIYKSDSSPASVSISFIDFPTNIRFTTRNISSLVTFSVWRFTPALYRTYTSSWGIDNHPSHHNGEP